MSPNTTVKARKECLHPNGGATKDTSHIKSTVVKASTSCVRRSKQERGASPVLFSLTFGNARSDAVSFRYPDGYFLGCPLQYDIFHNCPPQPLDFMNHPLTPGRSRGKPMKTSDPCGKPVTMYNCCLFTHLWLL